MNNKLAMFEDYKIRRVYDEKTETWYFSVVDIIQALLQQSDFQTARNYWKVLKNRLNKEGSEVVTNCNRLKLVAEDGKMRLTDVASPETLLRLIQSVPSPKAEPIKMWLARIGYTTASPDVFVVEAITRSEIYEANTMLADLSEEEFERFGDFTRRDESASIVTRPQMAKIRKLDRSIGEDLKILYEFRCQICGENFGKPYDQNIVEVHHIIQFVRSMNNDYDNLMIICPNHHTTIHKTNPIFDRQSLTLSYPNGYHEKLKLDRHFKLKQIGSS